MREDELFAGSQALAFPDHQVFGVRTPAQGFFNDAATFVPVLTAQELVGFVQLALDPREILIRFWPAMRAHFGDDLTRFAADVRKFVRLFCFAQWKRERFAISFRVTAFDLDPKTGFRFPPVQAPFTEELAEMDRYVQRVLEGENTSCS